MRKPPRIPPSLDMPMNLHCPAARAIAWSLIIALTVNPLGSAVAQVSVASGSTTVGQAGNGVSVINIAAPNAQGLSHNRYTDYNVGSQGLILNNATAAWQHTQLGGYIVGNPQLGGQAASLILNEVTGGRPSHLAGYTEIAGQAARLVVANPWGISCNGCGFLNSPRVTLTTGTPQLTDGRLSGYRVEGGEITIEGAGLNAGNIDQFDLVTRSARINAALHAQRLNLVAGRNEVDADALTATALAPDGNAPLLAIDSAALGGMYANSIMLLGTEAGVGVRLAGDMAASAGDIRIDAAGRLTLGRAAATGNVALTAPSASLAQSLHAGGHVDAHSTGDIVIGGVVAGDAGVAIQAGSLFNSAGATIASANGSVSLALTGTLDNRANAAVVAADGLHLSAATLLNDGGVISAGGDAALDVIGLAANGADGLVSAGGRLAARFGNWRNDGGRLLAGTDLALSGMTLSNVGGLLAADGALTLQLTDDLINRSGQIAGSRRAHIVAANVDNSGSGTVLADGPLTLSVSGQLDNQNDGLIYSRTGDVSLQAAGLDNRGGVVQAEGSIELAVDGALDNGGGSVIATGALDIQAGQVSNAQGTLGSAGAGLALIAHAGLDNAGGSLQGQTLALTAGGNLDNTAGRMAATLGNAQIDAAAVINRGGSLYASGDLELVTDTLDNQAGIIGAQNALIDAGQSLDNREGLIEAAGNLQLSATTLDNRAGALRAVGSHDTTRILADALDNRGGKVESANRLLQLDADALQNQGGTFTHVGEGDFQLSTQSVTSAGGSFASDGVLTLSADSWTNSSTLQARQLVLDIGQLTLTTDGALIATESFEGRGIDWHNDGLLASEAGFSLTLSGSYTGAGRLSAGGNLALQAGAVQLGGSAVVAAGGEADLAIAGTLGNAGRLTAHGSMTVAADTLDNRGTLGANDALAVRAATVTNEGGLLFAGGDLSLGFTRLTNRFADIYGFGAIRMAGLADGAAAGTVENVSGTIEAAGELDIHTAELINRKDVFATQLEQVAGVMSAELLYSSSSTHIADYTAVETFESRVTADSPAAHLLGGAGLTVRAGTLQNRYSTIASGSTLDIEADTLTNVGASTGTTVRTRTWNSGPVTDGSNNGFVFYDIALYNAAPVPKTVPMPLFFTLGGKTADDHLVSDVTTTTATGVGAPAIIQAAGNATLRVAGSLVNDVVAPAALPGGSSPAADTTLGNIPAVAVVTLNAQLPADLTQQRVDPLALPGFGLPAGSNGLFRLVGGDGGSASAGANGSATPHPYLIETNPALTQLGNFLSSNYLLGLLGYDTDAAQRRLGDGLYEQRLIRDAVVARTGQRYLAGLNTDEAMFRQLMDNAIASKDALQLSVGVSLSAEQVAALTHDIVWMEEQQVAGENVLVPVLYLAQGEGRLAPTGALIQGRDLTLIAGETLANRGTLRATENLSAGATTVLNTGLMQAGERLSVLAEDSVVNTRGGLLAGRNVDLTTLAGDIINERSVTQYAGSGQGITVSGSVVDAGARIEAADGLSISAGRDLYSIGSTLTASGDLDLAAGRHLVIASAEDSASRSTVAGRYAGANEQVTQFGSTVSAGGSMTLVAGADLAVTASRLEAGGDAMLLAGRDLTLSAAADMAHDNVATRGNRSFHRETLTVRQQAAEVVAGGNLTLAAGQDLTLVASAAQAGGEAYLYAGRDLALLAAQDQDYFLYDKKKKGSLGGKQTRRDEVTTVTQVGSRVEAGGNLTLESGEEQRYQVASLKSGADLTLDAGGDITFEGVKDLKQESHEKSSSSWAWTSMKGKGSTDETLRQSELVAAGKLVIEAAGKIRIDIPEVNQQTVSQTIAALVETEPQLAWLKEMESRGDIDWQRVKEVHDQWKYSHSGMGGVLAIVIAIVIAVVTYGAASSAIGAAAGTSGATAGTAAAGTAAAGTATAGTTVAGASSIWAAGTATSAAGWANIAVSAGLSGMASNTAVQVATTGRVEWDQVLKTGAVSAITAGLGNYGFFDGQSLNSLAGISAAPGSTGISNATGGISFSWDQVAGVVGRGVVNAGVSSAIQGTDFGTGFVNSVVGDYAALGANTIGSQWGNGQNPVVQTLAHIALGAGAAGLTGGDAAAGAIGGAVEAGLDNTLGQALRESGTELDQWDRLAYVVGAMLAGGVAAEAAGHDGVTAAQTAQNAAQNNFLSYAENEARRKAARACADGDPAACSTRDEWDALDQSRDIELRTVCYANGSSAQCSAKYAAMLVAMESYSGKRDNEYATDLNAGLEKYTAVSERESFKSVINAPHYDEKAIALMADAIRFTSNLAIDLTPGAGGVKAVAEAETGFDYVLAAIGELGPLGEGAKVLVKEAKALYEAGEAAKAAEKIAEVEKTLHASVGSKGAWDKLLNGQLEAKTMYELSNGHKYITDAAGRVKTVEGELSLTKMDRNTYQQCAAGKCGEVSDDGGHLIASSLGGVGDRINIVPQASTLNRGDWKAMENELRDALKSGDKVSLKIELGYPAGSGVRPSEFQVYVNISGMIKEFKFQQ